MLGQLWISAAMTSVEFFDSTSGDCKDLIKNKSDLGSVPESGRGHDLVLKVTEPGLQNSVTGSHDVRASVSPPGHDDTPRSVQLFEVL